MPKDLLAQQMHSAFPRLTFRGQAILDGLLLSGGSLGHGRQLALHLGLTTRFQLARLLRKDGLPPLHDLATWIRVLGWVEQAEASGCSLCFLAFHSKRDPSACYREVKRVTGRRWRELRERGSRSLLADFVAHCKAHEAPLKVS